MVQLEELTKGTTVKGILPNSLITIVDSQWHGSDVLEVTYSPGSTSLATDAAGEGINLQRAHLMVNYDLPWNPNRLEQRFGRIHRIGQTEVCHLWNLVAKETREGDVYLALLKKLEIEQQALGGKVFDVLGLAIAGTELRDLLI